PRAAPALASGCAGERRRLRARRHRRREGRGRVGGPGRARAARHGQVHDEAARAAAGRMKLIVGTRSPGKTREIRELFAGLPFDVSFPADRLLQPLPEEADLERSTSYVENAVSKARYYAARSGLPAVSDDSGIEVVALGGVHGPCSVLLS